MQDSSFPTFEVINMHNTKTLGFSSGERDAAVASLAAAERNLEEATAEINALRRDKAVLMQVVLITAATNRTG